MYDLSVIIPSINPEKWWQLLQGIKDSVGKYSFEVIFVGPHQPAEQFNERNVRFVQDRGCPARALQLGVSLANGIHFCWFPDDSTIDAGSLESCLDLIKDKPKNHGITMRYDEGDNKQDQDPSYWIGSTHTDLRLLGIHPDWKISPVFFYHREYFIEVGGISCALEHINMNGHSLAFYIQYMGGVLHSSPVRVFSNTYQHPPTDSPIFRAYHENDYPRFYHFWNRENAVLDYKVDFDNWKATPDCWPRRYQ